MAYEKMTRKQLEAENAKLMKAKADIRAKQIELNAALAKKIAEEKVAAKVAALSDDEKTIAAQVLKGAGGIKSGEAVGTPGAK